MRPLLITDLDNTLYNWVDYYAKSFRGMVHALSRELKIDEDSLHGQFKEVFALHSTVEYAFSIQELACCQNLNHFEIERLVKIGKGAFTRVRDVNLKPYPGVSETLEWLQKNKIMVVGVTNAPLFQAKMRLRQLHLDKFFDGLAGWEGDKMPEDKHTEDIRMREINNAYQTKIRRLWSLSKAELKPSPFGYLRVIKDLHTSHKVSYIVGDSLTKDVAPAMEIGATAIFAQYGTVFEKKNFETLLKITPWTEEKVKSSYELLGVTPNLTISSFDELMRVLLPQQTSLF